MNQKWITNVLDIIYSLTCENQEYAKESKVIYEYISFQSTSHNIKNDEVDLLTIAEYSAYLLSEEHNYNLELLDAINKIIYFESQKLRLKSLHKFKGLYVIIDPEITNGRDPLLIAESSIRGGAKILQLRDKLSDKGVILQLAKQIQDLCNKYDVALIINDHADIAKSVGSFGLHVGQTDLTVEASRTVLNVSQHIGRSNRELDQLAESELLNIDHVAFGPMFSTNTKVIDRQPQGIDRLKQARQISNKPLVAIGGININNINMVIDCNPEAICVTGAVGLAENPESAALALSKCMGY